jgi:hypothetical protein
MEAEQMTACLLEEMRANQAKEDANLREMKEEMLAKLDAPQEWMMARIDSQPEKIESCLRKTETTDLEANPEKVDFKSEHQEFPKEDAAVNTVRALKKQP